MYCGLGLERNVVPHPGNRPALEHNSNDGWSGVVVVRSLVVVARLGDKELTINPLQVIPVCIEL
jgi:hypothetical protein